nr:hypothetical protein [Tanacetum cinerariifolium]
MNKTTSSGDRHKNGRSIKNKNTSSGDGFQFTFRVSNGVARERSRTRTRSNVYLEKASHHVLKFIGLEQLDFVELELDKMNLD